MKVPIRWLKDYVDIEVSIERLAERLTMAGLEAEKIETIGDGWDNVFVGVVRGVTPHPDADRLVLADVEAGEHRLTVVTGAPNIAEGQKVALALAGARLIDAYADELKYKTLKPGKIRGVTSEGMVCSEKELGLSDEHEGILVLEPEAPIGVPLQEWLGDTIIEFEITPNLVHAFSMIGIARDASAVLGSKLTAPPETNLSEFDSDEQLVTIEADDLCSRYVAVGVDGINVEPSPPWLARRLTAAGVRPVNNLVDITNYVMLEMGQPLHAFDRNTISTGKITVRRGHPGEQIETLDHRMRDLDDSSILITDGDQNAVGIAGVMGGVNSEISDTTTSIVLESAHFDMANIRHTSRRLKLRTDASVRFERGLDPELARSAAQRAVKLILDLCPNARVIAFDDTYPSPVEEATVTMPYSRIERVLGMSVEPAVALDALTRLDLQPRLENQGDVLQVTVPTWRSDITIPEDVVEEVARIVGYDALPATLPTGTLPEIERDPMFLLERFIRRTLAAAGMFEGRSYVTISDDEIAQWSSGESVSLVANVEPTQIVRLRNPVNAERPALRPAIAPSLLPDVAENLKHQERVKLFEIAHVFEGNGTGQLPEEPLHLAMVLSGDQHELNRFTASNSDDIDYWDAKGTLDALFARLGLAAGYSATQHPALHPGRTAHVTIGEDVVGLVGEVHPTLTGQHGIERRVAVAEVNVSKILEALPDFRGIQVTTDQFLPVEQDFSIVVAEDTPAAEVEHALRRGAGPLVTNVVLFDVYRGESLEPDAKSLTYRVTFTAPDRALTDKELAKTRTRIERILNKELKASLRA